MPFVNLQKIGRIAKQKFSFQKIY